MTMCSANALLSTQEQGRYHWGVEQRGAGEAATFEEALKQALTNALSTSVQVSPVHLLRPPQAEYRLPPVYERGLIYNADDPATWPIDGQWPENDV